MEIIYQKWRDLLFLHWECNPKEMQKELPHGLFADTFQGKCYIALIPFQMHGIRLRGLPPIPWVSNCLELNCRTYVTDIKGNPGIWFFSLHISKKLHALIGRNVFKLPYFYSKMDANFDSNPMNFHSENGFKCEWQMEGETSYAEEGSLEEFLVERRRLYTYSQKRLYKLDVFHPPYPLKRAKIQSLEIGMDKILHRGAVQHVICSPGTDVALGPLELIPNNKK